MHPLSLVACLLLLELGYLLVELTELLLVLLAAYGLALDLELGDASPDLVEPLGEGVDLHT